MALLEDSLIAHYKMNDNLATDVILDETGNHNGAVKDATGTATSAFHSVAGKILNAQEFDGVDDYIEVSDHADFTPAAGGYSISAWVNMDDASNFWIASKGKINVDAELWFFVTSTDTLRFLLFDESVNSCYIGRTTSGTLTSYQNKWIHLVVTFDGGTLSSGVELYINSICVDASDTESNAGSFVAVENLAHDVWVGQYDNTNYANGTIDNLMFFNKELTPLEVQLLYNSGAGVETIPTGIHLSRTGQHFSSFPEN